MDQDAIKEIRTFTYENAIVRVHIPDLTEDERKMRIKKLKHDTEIFMKKVMKKGKENEAR